MMVAHSDVLIEFLRGRSPWAGRMKLEIETGHLATTVISSFELLGGVNNAADQERVSRLLAGLTVLGVTPEASERAAVVRRALDEHGLGIAMADCLIAGICLVTGGVLLTRNQDHFSRVPDLKLGGRHL